MRRLIAAALLVCGLDVAAADEHRRLLAAELVVIAGDLRRLREETPGAREANGLRARIAGALAALPLLMRRAGTDARPVTLLREYVARDDWQAFASALARLQRQYPFDPSHIDDAPTPQKLAFGAAIHRQACAGCHDAPPGDVELPARDLFAEARRLPRAEFIARLLLGVRGDRSTAWRNPFSELELAALAAHYRHAVSGR